MWPFLMLLSCTPEQLPQNQVAEPAEPQAWAHTQALQPPWMNQRVIIIGAGPAGLAAAMDLPGALVLEAGERTGGRAPGSSQLLYFVGSVQQAAVGIQDSPEAASEEWEDLTGAPPTQATWDYWTALPQVSQRLHDIGLDFILNPPTPWSTTSRLHGAKDPGLPAALEGAWPDNIELRLNTRVTGLRIRDGRVVGVMTDDGAIDAGVVLIASGGFSNRVDLISEYVGWDDGTWNTNGKWGAEGDAIDWANTHGLGLDAMHAMGSYADAIAMGPGEYAQILEKNGPQPFIWVNADGERFVDEGQDFSLYLSNRVQEEPGPVWTLITWEELGKRVPEEHHGILETVVCSDSWEALAVEIQVDPEGLRETLGTLQGNRMKLDGQPCAYPPGLTAAKGYGGLLVDAQQRVLDAGGTPVPGLYAAGEASGMAVPGMGGLYGFDGSLSAVVWSGWRAAESINDSRF